MHHRLRGARLVRVATAVAIGRDLQATSFLRVLGHPWVVGCERTLGRPSRELRKTLFHKLDWRHTNASFLFFSTLSCS
jgi:hypothetical protein